jgi:K+-transporting ATPase ATPase A chain
VNTTTAAIVMVAVLVAVLAIVHVPFGDYMARVYSSPRHLRVERGIYRLVGVDAGREQTWGVYARSVLAFSLFSVLFLYLFQRVQAHLPLNLGFRGYRRRSPSTPRRRS